MTFRIRRSAAATVIMLLLLALFPMLNTPAARADNVGGFDRYNGQPGEPVGVTYEPCTNGGTISTVFSKGGTVTVTPVASAWNVGLSGHGIWYVPLSASNGWGALGLNCAIDGAISDYPFGIGDFEVTSPSSSISYDQSNIGSVMKVEAAGDCTGPGQVDLTTLGVVSTPTGNLTKRFPLASALVNSSGYWSVNVFIDPDEFQSGADIYVHPRVYCDSSGYWFDTSPRKITAIPNKYVAIGDSYSSGEGAYNYIAASGNCHRSTDSYAYYVAGQLILGVPNFGACSGAVTDDIWSWNPVNTNEIPQEDRLTSSTQFVTLTIGGNDVGFAEVGAECVHTPGHTGFNCSTGSYLPNAVNDRLAALDGGAYQEIDDREIHSIANVLRAIKAKAPNAEIYIGGYPHLFGSSFSYFAPNASAPGGASCIVATGGTVSYTDAQWMNAKADQLNAIIDDAVDEVTLEGVNATYVPALFATHSFCDSGALWLNQVGFYPSSVNPVPESFHPTPAGMYFGYGIGFEASMN